MTERRDDTQHSEHSRDSEHSRHSEQAENASELAELAAAVARAEAERPAGGYQLSDFDDIPFPPDHRPANAAPAPERPEGVRLQKALAHAGVASRRVCEQLITAGRVKVNGSVVTELGTRIDPDNDRVVVDGTPVQLDQTKRYLILNKPVKVVSSMRDEHGRRDLREFTKQYPERLYNVGRLDYETSGLLILTNDGELAHVLAHPSFGVSKTYVAKVDGRMPAAAIQQLRDGIELEDGFIQADSARILAAGSSAKSTLVEITLHSGKNRIVRRMLAHVGYPVRELVRRSFGPLHLGTLRQGEIRELTSDELGQLLRLGSGESTDHGKSDGHAGKQQSRNDRGGARGGQQNRGKQGGRGHGSHPRSKSGGTRGGQARGDRGSQPRGRRGGSQSQQRRDGRGGGQRRGGKR